LKQVPLDIENEAAAVNIHFYPSPKGFLVFVRAAWAVQRILHQGSKGSLLSRRSS
jgi:hypothetical protein